MAVAPADIPAMAAARAVADAVLYEGYLLYPYRRSAAKNRIRWQFGVLLPPAWARSRGLDSTTVAGSAESWWQQTECLLEAGPAAEADIRVRFLQVQRRLVEERGANGSCLPAPEPGGDGRMELSFDEAVPREFSIRARVSDLMAAERRVPLEAAGGEEASPLDDGGGSPGRVVRQRLPVTASVLVSAEPCGQATGLARLRVRIENTGGVAQQAPRQEALRVSLIG
ncbi:MAG: hypothetical protein JO242_16940, partial [Streptosporangiaceae bacterium]|nr:hypothetical protein [Streptosporangiaceae bacterium]